MKRTTQILFALLLCVGSARPVPARPESARAEVAALLTAQIQAWNQGDLDAFMQGYWQSDRTEFVGSSGIVRCMKPEAICVALTIETPVWLTDRPNRTTVPFRAFDTNSLVRLP